MKEKAKLYVANMVHVYWNFMAVEWFHILAQFISLLHSTGELFIYELKMQHFV